MGDPKKLLAALQANEQLPYPAEAVAMAREALVAPPSPDALSQLPAPLQDAVFEGAVVRRDARWIEQLLTAPQKDLVKRAKKAAYRLKSAGVEVEAPASAAEAPPQSRPPEPTEELPALLSGVSGTGERALVVVRPVRGGGLDLYQLVLSDEQGVLHAERYPMSRGDYRQQLKALRRGEVPATLEIATARAKEELAEAQAANLASRTPVPPHGTELLRLLEVAPTAPGPLPPPEEGDAVLATEAHTLHDEPEIRGWLPPESELQLLSQRMEQIIRSPLQLSDAQRAQQMFEVFRKGAEEFFTPDRKQLYARRLWRMAELFEHTGRERQAKVARAEARRLFHNPQGFFSRFTEMLYEKVLHISKALQQKQEPPEAAPKPPSLILP